MNYARHFSSEVEAGTAANHYYLNKDGTVSSTTFASASSIVKEQVLGAAIERTLKDCGMSNAKYYGTVDDKPVSYLCLDDTEDGKPGFYIYIAASYVYFYLGYCAASSDTVITHVASMSATSGTLGVRSTATPFSTATLAANTFDTYIKVVGDPTSSFYIAFTSYGTTTEAATSIIAISNMVDKRDDKDVFAFYFGAKTFTASAPIYKSNLVNAATGASSPSQVSAYVFNGTYTMQNNFVMLINQYVATYPHLWFKNGYIRPSSFSPQSFYEVDGDVYYVTDNTIFKCPTSVNPG